ncbi:L-asparagine transporter [Desulfotomaculum arcticum]|uniref:L-asparagine transporter n=1 Tax=Desulfotruncus arcticus DSM 17038 TaxID=1121424 RepID=A0A1I2X6H0_9FIRM|nr:amino acid permease [Desulfotruncus arcticus]SFH09105.1 L-asparagine transporter [Desulfotomaculum arcticum] [Desulfotruncus arcticus DSM 17038]
MQQQLQLKEDLHRGLRERHIQLIALGGAIGVGLFLGSASAIKTAGPALMLSYMVGGLVIFAIMRALGEIAVSYPVSGSFSAYANTFLGPLPGYLTGWTYWFMWVVTCMAEITAVGIYVNYWLPELPQWIPALAALLVMTLVNLINVKAYGEFEFWFALIKVVTIIAMILIGLGMIIFGLGHGGVSVGISNLWTHGGFFAHGIKGVVMSLSMVMFAYLGIELIGVTAGEAENPEKTIPAAIDKVFWRILIFYVGALFVIMALFPWNEIGTKGSPFVLTFNAIGIRAAAGIINFVVLTAALSSCNSGLFSTGRMLYNLALQKKAPRFFAKVSRSGIPALGIIVSAVFLLVGVVLNYLVPAQVFIYITSVATFGALFVWAIILLVQIKYRSGLSPQEIKNLRYPMPWYPVSSYLSLAFLVFVLVILAFDPSTRVALYVGPVWLVLLLVSYYALGMNKQDSVSGRPAYDHK